MKLSNNTLLLGAAALVGIILMTKRKGASSASSAASSGAQEISQANGAAWQNGWRYFSDGTAIDPSGNYYRGGVLIYRAGS